MNESDNAAELVYDPAKCPWTAALSVIGGKWKGLIWWRLSRGLTRSAALQRSIPQVSRKMLTQQLRELERDGIVSRRIYPEVPPRVEYALTDYGKSLAPVFETLYAWGDAHLQRKGAPDEQSSSEAPY